MLGWSDAACYSTRRNPTHPATGLGRRFSTELRAQGGRRRVTSVQVMITYWSAAKRPWNISNENERALLSRGIQFPHFIMQYQLKKRESTKERLCFSIVCETSTASDGDAFIRGQTKISVLRKIYIVTVESNFDVGLTWRSTANAMEQQFRNQ